MSEKRRIGVNSIIYGGVLLALIQIFLFLAGAVPGVELTLYAFSTLMIMIMVEETSLKSGWVLFVSSCFLAFLIVPNKLAVFPYAGFFGLYGTVKYHIEHIRKRILELALKISFLTIVLISGLCFFKEALLGVITIQGDRLWIPMTAALVIFLVYDQLLTLLLNYYRKRLSGFLKIG